MCKQNLGKLDRVLRFLLAFWWLGPWAPEFANETVGAVLMVIAWIALVESFLGWCWIHDALRIDNKNQ